LVLLFFFLRFKVLHNSKWFNVNVSSQRVNSPQVRAFAKRQRRPAKIKLNNIGKTFQARALCGWNLRIRKLREDRAGRVRREDSRWPD
jgi:hypothetical protein